MKMFYGKVTDGMNYNSLYNGEWKDCTTCDHFCKWNFTCDLFGANVLANRTYETCGEYTE